MSKQTLISKITSLLWKLPEDKLEEFDSLLFEYSRDEAGIPADPNDLKFKLKACNFYRRNGNALPTVKFIKDNSGWGLKESKDYFDNEVKPNPNFDLKYKLGKLLDGQE